MKKIKGRLKEDFRELMKQYLIDVLDIGVLEYIKDCDGLHFKQLCNIAENHDVWTFILDGYGHAVKEGSQDYYSFPAEFIDIIAEEEKTAAWMLEEEEKTTAAEDAAWRRMEIKMETNFIKEESKMNNLDECITFLNELSNIFANKDESETLGGIKKDLQFEGVYGPEIVIDRLIGYVNNIKALIDI